VKKRNKGIRDKAKGIRLGAAFGGLFNVKRLK
jgi:hypothetical protein